MDARAVEGCWQLEGFLDLAVELLEPRIDFCPHHHRGLRALARGLRTRWWRRICIFFLLLSCLVLWHLQALPELCPWQCLWHAHPMPVAMPVWHLRHWFYFHLSCAPFRLFSLRRS